MVNFLAELISTLADYRIQMSMHYAALTVLALDWSLTLSDEITYIWKAKWSPIKMIFLLNRYILPLHITFAAYVWSGAAHWLTGPRCKIFFDVDSIVTVLFFSGLHCVVTMRTWALWGRSRWSGIVLWGTCLTDLAVTDYLTFRFLQVLKPSLVPQFHVCFAVLPSFMWATWLPSIIFEIVIFLFTAIKAFQHAKQGLDNTWLSVFYRDGFLYFVFITADSLVNLSIWADGQASQAAIFRYFSLAICQAAGSHLIIDFLSSTEALKSSQAKPPFSSYSSSDASTTGVGALTTIQGLTYVDEMTKYTIGFESVVSSPARSEFKVNYP